MPINAVIENNSCTCKLFSAAAATLLLLILFFAFVEGAKRKLSDLLLSPWDALRLQPEIQVVPSLYAVRADILATASRSESSLIRRLFGAYRTPSQREYKQHMYP